MLRFIGYDIYFYFSSVGDMPNDTSVVKSVLQSRKKHTFSIRLCKK